MRMQGLSSRGRGVRGLGADLDQRLMITPPGSQNTFYERTPDGGMKLTLNLTGVMENLLALLQSAPVDIYVADGIFMDTAAAYCALHPVDIYNQPSPGCENAPSIAERYIQRYREWSMIAPEYQNPSLATPLTSSYIPAPVYVDAGQYIPSTMTPYQPAPVYVSPLPGAGSTVAAGPASPGGVNTLDAVAPGTLAVITGPAVNAMSPPSGSTAVTPQSIANAMTVTGGASLVNGPGAGTMAAEASPGFDTSEITTWIKANWILIAAGVGALILLPALIPRR